MAKRKRVVYRVHYVGREKVWAVTMASLDGVKIRIYSLRTKRDATDSAVIEARGRWRLAGQLTQVVVHGKDGRISWERTYGQDPARRKG